MSEVTAKIRSIYNSLSEAERKVADYILKNEEEVPFKSVYEIAKAVDVSVPSVSRLTKRIGYKNFKDFKIKLAKDTSSTVRYIYSAITQDDGDEELIRKVFLGNIRTLEDTLKLIEDNGLVEMAKILAKAKRIVFLGIGGSGTVANDAALRFSHLDIQAEGYNDPIQILLQTKRLKKNEVVVGISHSGRTGIVLEALKIALQNGAITVCITNYMNSPMKEHCSYFFCTAFEENHVKVAALSSHLAQLCLIDALYLLTARYKKKLWDVEDLDSNIERNLRVKY